VSHGGTNSQTTTLLEKKFLLNRFVSDAEGQAAHVKMSDNFDTFEKLRGIRGRSGPLRVPQTKRKTKHSPLALPRLGPSQTRSQSRSFTVPCHVVAKRNLDEENGKGEKLRSHGRSRRQRHVGDHSPLLRAFSCERHEDTRAGHTPRCF